jgi:hypothetical protein
MAKPIHDASASIHSQKTNRARVKGNKSSYSCSFLFIDGYGHSPMHLLNKCETCDKNIKREQCGKKNRFALSFSAFSDILCSRKE